MFDWESILYSIPAVIIGLTVHEFSHAYVAYRLGDSTAKEEGRLTLNPLKHIDLIGMLFLVVAGFGWARPVRFNPENLRKPGRDRVLIALAGPASNLVVGTLALLVAKLLIALLPTIASPALMVVIMVFYYLGYVNYGLFVFNLLPIPPLDGSHAVFQSLRLEPELEAKMVKFGTYALFVIFSIERRAHIDLLPIGKVVDAMASLIL